jgi:hypothetical protein
MRGYYGLKAQGNDEGIVKFVWGKKSKSRKVERLQVKNADKMS